MKKSMMKNQLIKIVVLILFVQFNLNANITSGYFIPENNAIDSEVSSLMANKIKTALSKNGINVVESYYPLVTVVKYDEISVSEISGMKKMYQSTGNVTITMYFMASSIAAQKADMEITGLGSMDFEIVGVGDSKSKSAKNALRKISFDSKEFKDFTDKVKKLYEESQDEFNKKCISEAKKFMAKQDTENALNYLGFVSEKAKPAERKEADKLIAQVIEENKRQQAKAERHEEEDRTREHELNKKLVDAEIQSNLEDKKIRQEELKVEQSRVNAQKSYYDAFHRYYGW